MHLLHPSAPFRHTLSRYLALPALSLGFTLIAWQTEIKIAVAQQPIFRQRLQFDARNRAQPNDQDSVSGVYLPTDRALSRAVTRARERLKSQEFHEVLPFLQGILS